MKRILLILSGSVALVFIFAFAITIFQQYQSVDFIPKAAAQACTAPAAVTGVTVEFPGCVTATTCNLTEASCKWNSQADAASYNVTVTEVETNTLIKNNESQPSSTTKLVFPITQGKTYKCSVTAVSSCGAVGAAGVDQLLCQADALISPSPTVAPTATPTPTKVPPTPTPTIAKPGGVVPTIALTGGILFAIIGGVVLLLL